MTARIGILFTAAGLSAALAIATVTACQSAPDRSRALAQVPAPGASAESAMGAWQPRQPVVQVRGENELRAKMGLPPRGYWRTIGNEVPDWTPDGPGQRSALLWFPIGPRPVIQDEWSGGEPCTGRVVSIAPHPFDPNIVYIASASGGIWKTIDGGGNWSPMSDHIASLNHGIVALCLSQPDTVFAGTGEYTTDSVGGGIFRSDDAGVTWTRVGTSTAVGPRFTGIAVNPLDPNVVHVTTSQGYYHTTDGGTTWTLPTTGLPVGACTGIAMDVFSPGGNTIFVARNGDGIYKSLDGGVTMGKLTGLPDPATSDFNRIVLAMSPTDGDTLYAAFIAPDRGLEGPDHNGFYKTTDGGNSWTRLSNTPNFPKPMGDYSCAVAVDPADPNTVYCGGVAPMEQDPDAVNGIIRSTDGGGSWTDVTGNVHRFMQGFAFGPDGTVWVASEGGVWKSLDQGDNWINCNATLHVTQHFHGAQNPQDSLQMVSGTRGSGAVITIGSDVWGQFFAGNAGWCAYDDTTGVNRFYYSSANLRVARAEVTFLEPGLLIESTELTGLWVDPVTFLPRENLEYIAPLVIDPNDNNTLYVGTYRPWRNESASSSSITGDPPEPSQDWEPKDSVLFDSGDALHTIAIAPADSNRVYAGSAAGKFFVSSDGAESWKRYAKNENPGDFRVDIFPVDDVSDIMVDPDSSGSTLYVSFFNQLGARIFKTTNPTDKTSWTSITGNMPNGARVYCLAADWHPPEGAPPVFFAGTGAGIYTSTDQGVTWVKTGPEFPNVLVSDLFIEPTDRTITAVTYGRGVWRASLDGCVDVPVITDEPDSSFACEGDQVTFSVTATGTMLNYLWFKDGFPILPAVTTPFHIIPAVGPDDDGLYQCLAFNDCGYDVSDVAELTIGHLEARAQPQQQSVCEGDPVSFCFGVTAVPPATYQWYKNGVPIPGAIGSCYSIASATQADIGSYYCEATNMCAGPLASQPVGLAVGTEPTITTQPQSQSVALGSSVTFSVVATGAPPPTYLWRKDGVPIAGATSSSYTIPSVSTADLAGYSVTVSNSCGSLTSDTASLTAGGCPIDFTMDGVIDFGDYLEFLNLFDALDPRADLNMDGVIDFGDYLEFLNHFDAGC